MKKVKYNGELTEDQEHKIACWVEDNDHQSFCLVDWKMTDIGNETITASVTLRADIELSKEEIEEALNG